MRHIFTVFIFLVAFGCSEKIPFERQIKQRYIQTTGIEPIVISVVIDSIVPPDSTKRVYEGAYEVKQTHLVLFSSRMVRSYEGLVKEAEEAQQSKILKYYPKGELERRTNHTIELKAVLADHQKRLVNAKDGNHPQLDSIAQLIASPKEWQQVTARLKHSESSPVLVRKILFAIGNDTTVVDKLYR